MIMTSHFTPTIGGYSHPSTHIQNLQLATMSVYTIISFKTAKIFGSAPLNSSQYCFIHYISYNTLLLVTFNTFFLVFFYYFRFNTLHFNTHVVSILYLMVLRNNLWYFYPNKSPQRYLRSSLGITKKFSRIIWYSRYDTRACWCFDGL